MGADDSRPAGDWELPLAALAALGVVAAACICLGGYRAFEGRHVSGPYDPQQDGFFDFAHGVYYPCQAFVDGVSPYGQAFVDGYPVADPVPLYTPSHFLLHAPLTLLPLLPASVTYFALLLAMIYAIARLSADAAQAPGAWPLIGCLLLMTRGGQATLASGYFTLELVLGALVALRYAASRPWLSACGVLLAAGKPTYLIPLLILLAVRGNLKAAVRGGGLTGVASAAAVGWLAAGGRFDSFLASITDSTEARAAQVDQLPINSFTQVDLLSLISKWMDWSPGYAVSMAVMLVLLTPIGVALRRLNSQGDSAGAATQSGALAALAIVVTVFHQSYDALLLVAAITGLATGRPERSWRGIPRWARWGLAALCLTPSFNLLSTRAFLQKLGIAPPDTGFTLVTSINGTALAAALLLMLWLACRRCATRAEERPPG
ncbi:hypothetical protein KOR34_12700 [Posidoniimonas corsicana]|uniref:Polyprenol-phosphate-mannose-dependent alpha-(1-2)-phosphatidylinositol mannoside mannosyltransferase n=1 Tax=Posidoniimonas corsicana TaxID=1938618 RepID=A0A5C5VF89_9BACT|nr:glycosyltransferase family 87 protein [Posidoniimonas corsicana]TWT36365.1 hypothetical protein KOR34_12700 [Posidoniimonas corsicana]